MLDKKVIMSDKPKSWQNTYKMLGIKPRKVERKKRAENPRKASKKKKNIQYMIIVGYYYEGNRQCWTIN